MNLRSCILTENDCFRAGRTLLPRGVMVHSTGANNPDLKRYVQPDDGFLGENRNGNSWNQPGLQKCVHAFVGRLEDGTVACYQTLPWTMRGWHAGGAANNTHIGFEICEDDLTGEDYFRAVYREAAELTAYLCKLFQLDPLADGVVLCHHEGYRRGIASGHVDVDHWFPRHGASMDQFRQDVRDLLERKGKTGGEEEREMQYYHSVEEVPEWYRPTIRKLVEQKAIQGTDDKGTLDISEDFCQVMTVLDRLGKL